MPKIEEFFTSKEEQQVIDAIKSAEKDTSGEIRVHIEKSTDKDPLERAKEVFYELKMNETQAQNGVLFYVATESHHFAILGDKGINELVAEDFWDTEKLSDEIVNILENEKSTKQMINNNNKILKHLSWDRPAINVLNTYNSVI